MRAQATSRLAAASDRRQQRGVGACGLDGVCGGDRMGRRYHLANMRWRSVTYQLPNIVIKIGLGVSWTTKTRGFVGPDVCGTVKTRGLVELGVKR